MLGRDSPSRRRLESFLKCDQAAFTQSLKQSTFEFFNQIGVMFFGADRPSVEQVQLENTVAKERMQIFEFLRAGCEKILLGFHPG